MNKFNAIAKQYEVKDAISKNLLNLSGSKEGYIAGDGGEVTAGHCRYTDYIPVVAGETYTIILNQAIYNIGVSVFDSSKSVLTRYNNWSAQYVTFTVPNGGVFTRLWFSYDEKNPVSVAFLESLEAQLRIGAYTYPPPYMPFSNGQGFASWRDGLKSGFPSVKMLGKTFQQTYDGKNLFDTLNASRATKSPGYAVIDERTEGGMTVSQTITAKYRSVNFVLPEDLAGKEVTIVGDWVASGENTGALRIEWMENGATVQPHMGLETTVSGQAKTVTITPKPEGATEDVELCFLVYSNWTGTSLPGDTVTYQNIMVCVGTDTTYEPYVGGIPAPNPDYPQEVVGNDATVKSTNADGTYDGGTATAPALYGIGEYQDEWNPQTGKGVRRIRQFTYNGTEDWYKNADYGDYKSFYRFNEPYFSLHSKGFCNILPSAPWENIDFVGGNYFWVAPSSHGFRIHKSYLGDDYDSLTTDSERIDRFKVFLSGLASTGCPVQAGYYSLTPEPFQTDPMPLTCPTGYGQVIQVDGSIADCPLEVKYLAHGGNKA